MKEWIKRMGTQLGILARDFVLIYGLTMMVTWAWCRVLWLDVELGVTYLENILLFSLGAALPRLVYLSKRELTETQLLIRTLIHTVVLTVVLLTMGHYIGMWRTWREGILFFCCILGVDVLVRLLGYGGAAADAAAINRKLKERREHNGSSN